MRMLKLNRKNMWLVPVHMHAHAQTKPHELVLVLEIGE